MEGLSRITLKYAIIGGHKLYILEHLSEPEINAFVSELSVRQCCKNLGRYVI